MRYLRTLGIVVVVLAVLVFGALVAVSFVDINEYKALVSDQVKQATGRDLSIEGALELKISLFPTVSVQDVRLANSSWGSQAHMVTVREAEAQIAVFPLLSGEIQLYKLVLNEPDILLETNKEGRGNWEFHPKIPEDIPEPETKDDSTGLTLKIRKVEIEKGRFIYRDGVSGKTTKLNLDEVLVEHKGPDEVDWELRAQYNDIPVELEATTELIYDLLQNEPFAAQLTAKVGDVNVTVDGAIARPLDAKGIDLNATVKTPDLKTLSQLADTELPPVGPIDLKTSISEDGELYLVKLNGGAGDVKLELDGQLAQSLDGKGLNLEVSVKAPDLKTFSTIAGTELPSIGPIAVTAKGSEAKDRYQVAMNGAAGRINLSADGHIARSLDGKGINLNLWIKAPDLKMLGELGGTELPAVGPVDVKGRLSDIKGGYRVTKLLAKLGSSDLSGNASVAYEAKPLQISAQLNSQLLDLSPFEKQEPALEKDQAKKPRRKQAQKPNQRIFPADPLSFDQLKTANADVNFRAKKIQTRTRNLQNVEVDLSLKHGKLNIMPLQARTKEGSIHGDVSIDASKSKPRLAINLNVSDVELGKLKQLKDVVRGGKTSTSIKLSGAGSSIREIMAGLNGQTVVNVGRGQIVNKNLNLVGADLLSEIVEKIGLLEKKSKTSTLDCLIIRFNIKNGMATTDKGIAVETDKMVVIGSGAINLKTEAIDLGIRTDARERTGIGAGELTKVVRLRGTLANPTPEIDTIGVAAVGATVGAAIATGGLSYLAQKAYGAATKDMTPCLTALGKTPMSTAHKKSGEADQSSKAPAPSGGVKKWFDDASSGAKKWFDDAKRRIK